ncbi:MAG: DNA-directed RNA polymerase subunit K [Candidatus Bathyarchaeota archaeon]|nr:DNA-directed RNA polymerase subunit K [Candidatus Bathyarchaeota archaeon]
MSRRRVLKTKEKKIEVGPPKITRFEKARIVGARALQISMGAPILVDAEENTNPIDIAVSELEAKILPITIRRTLPDGTFQDIPLKWLS